MSTAIDLSVDWAITSFTPWDARLNHQNVWDIYRRIRDRAPAVRSDAHEDFWVIGRYADVKRAAGDFRTFSSGSGAVVGFKGTSNPPGAPIEYDPPDHARFRKVMAEPFRPSNIGAFEGLVQRHVGRILDEAAVKRTFDVVHDIAEPLSVSVISDILGFDPSQRDLNRAKAVTLIRASYEEVPAARAAYKEFMLEQVDANLREPGSGLLGEFARISEGGTVFTRDEVYSMAHAVALAGHHTTINGISSVMIRAAQQENRERWLSDLDDLAAVKTFVEEAVRIDPPIHLEARRTTAEANVDGVMIPAGHQVALLYASANHDEGEFQDPEVFDVDREARHLTFGHGIHTCLGMALARMEMTAVLRGVLDRFPEFRLVQEPVDSGMVFGHHMGWASVPATIG